MKNKIIYTVSMPRQRFRLVNKPRQRFCLVRWPQGLKWKNLPITRLESKLFFTGSKPELVQITGDKYILNQ